MQGDAQGRACPVGREANPMQTRSGSVLSLELRPVRSEWNGFGRHGGNET